MRATERAAHDVALTGVAVALVATLTLGGAGYLAWAWFNGDPAESVSRALNEASQIEASVKLYENENGGTPLKGTSSEQFHVLQASGYLAGAPTGWRLDRGRAFRPLASTVECMRFNVSAGMDVTSHAVRVFEGCPPCEMREFAKYPACDREVAAPEERNVQPEPETTTLAYGDRTSGPSPIPATNGDPATGGLDVRNDPSSTSGEEPVRREDPGTGADAEAGNPGSAVEGNHGVRGADAVVESLAEADGSARANPSPYGTLAPFVPSDVTERAWAGRGRDTGDDRGANPAPNAETD